MKSKHSFNFLLKNIPLAIRLIWVYLLARIILLFHYNQSLFIRGKDFHGGRYGRFTSTGWEWIVRDYFACRRACVNKDVPWPVSANIRVVCPNNIEFSPDDIRNFQGFGNYFQAIGKISIGCGSYIAPNVGIITANHLFNQLEIHDKAKPVSIGDRCWIGMNSVILPGVTLGHHTIVGAGSIVTKSFEAGNCIIAGNPAKIIKHLNADLYTTEQATTHENDK